MSDVSRDCGEPKAAGTEEPKESATTAAEPARDAVEAAEATKAEGGTMSSSRSRWVVIAVACVGFAVGMAATIRFDAPPPTHAISFWGSDDDEEEKEKQKEEEEARSQLEVPAMTFVHKNRANITRARIQIFVGAPGGEVDVPLMQ